MHASRLRLRDDLPFCRLDGGTIFLDLRNDTYFKLSKPMDRAFASYLENGECNAIEMNRLLQQGVLVDAPETPSFGRTCIGPAPSRSIIEQHLLANAFPIRSALDVLWITTSIRLQLRTRPLHRILGSLDAYRRLKAPSNVRMSGISAEPSLQEDARAFLHARLYIPIETRCLLDSLAMAWFLAKRGHHASVVFGVTSDPFSAHCWVQSEDLLLNDTIGNVEMFTQIWAL